MKPSYEELEKKIETLENEFYRREPEKELSLLQKEILLRQGIENSISGGIAIMDENGKQIYVSQSFCELLGRNESELLQKFPPYNYWAPRDVEKIQKAFQQTLAHQAPKIGYELTFCHKSGKEIPVRVIISTIIQENNKKNWIAHVTDISEKKQTDLLTRNIQNQFSDIAEASSDIIWECDGNGNFIYLNSACEKILGYPAHEMLNKPFFSFQPLEYAKRDLLNFQHTNYVNEVITYDTVYKHKNGQDIHLTFNSKYKFDEDGNFDGARGTAKDLTQLKSYEKEILCEKFKYTQLYNTVKDAVVFTDLNGMITNANTAFVSLLGYPLNELVKFNFKSITPPKWHQTQGNTILNNLNEKGFSEPFEKEYIHKNGSLIPVEIKIFLNKDKDNRPYELCAIIRDISEQKKLEQKYKEQNEEVLAQNEEYEQINEELIQLNEELRASKEKTEIINKKFETLADYLPGFIAYVNANTMKYEFVNKQYQKSFGIPIDQIIGSHVKDIVGEENFKFALKYIDKVKAGQSIFYENVFTLVEGQKWIKVNYVPEFDKDGNVASIIVMTYDISEQKQAEAIINKKNIELQQINNDKDLFFSIIAHDLRGPFNSILGFLNLLSENINEYSTKEIENFIHVVYQSAIQTFNLLEDILMWAKTQLGKISFESQNLNFLEICEEINGNLKIIANSKNIKLNYSAHPHLIIWADKQMINIILRNLIANAIKFTPTNGNIDISAEIVNNMVVVTVSDNGVGIEPKVLDKLFNLAQIHTSPGTANEKGTGLGLILCKEFVEKHGGKIWVNSQFGQGSTFNFSLPLEKNEKSG